jgi:CheY-like chemotaxis protein
LPDAGGRQQLVEDRVSERANERASERITELPTVATPVRFRFELRAKPEFTGNRHARKPSETSGGDDQTVLEGLSSPDALGVIPPNQIPAALLVITDDPELRDLLMELAIEEGWGVRAVATEAEGAVAVQTERPGLVLVDLDMESRAGGKFLRTLRRSPHRDIPCFAVTNSNNTMLAVTLDAPVYFKPALDGLPEALLRLFGPALSGSAMASSITAPRSAALPAATPSATTPAGVPSLAPTIVGPRRPTG